MINTTHVPVGLIKCYAAQVAAIFSVPGGPGFSLLPGRIEGHGLTRITQGHGSLQIAFPFYGDLDKAGDALSFLIKPLLGSNDSLRVWKKVNWPRADVCLRCDRFEYELRPVNLELTALCLAILTFDPSKRATRGATASP